MLKRTLVRWPLVGGALVFLLLALVSLPRTRGQAQVAGWSGEYFQNQELRGRPSDTRVDPVLTFDWGDGPPIWEEGWPSDHFSARWTRTDNFMSGTYVFAARSDDGIRMYVDGVLIMDEWEHRQFHWTAVEHDMIAGQHRIMVEFFEDIGRAAIQAGYYPKFAMPSATPTPTRTRTPTPGPSPTSTISGGGGSGGGTAIPRPTRVPTSPSIQGTPGRTPTPNDAPPAVEAGSIIYELSAKEFTWLGFPGPVVREGGHADNHAYVKNQLSKATLTVWWNFVSDRGGFYDVYAYIPPSNLATRAATYQLFAAGRLSDPVMINQSQFANRWVLLGNFYFVPSQVQYVSLNNVTGEPSATREVLLDAVLFIRKD